MKITKLLMGAGVAAVLAISMLVSACGNADLADFPVEAPAAPTEETKVTFDLSAITAEQLKELTYDEEGAYDVKIEDGKLVIVQSKSPKQYSGVSLKPKELGTKNTLCLKIANEGTADAEIVVSVSDEASKVPCVVSTTIADPKEEAAAEEAKFARAAEDKFEEGKPFKSPEGWGYTYILAAGKTKVWTIVYDASKKPEKFTISLNSQKDKADNAKEAKIVVSEITLDKSDDADKAVKEAAEKQKKIEAIKGFWTAEDVGFYFNDGKLYIAGKNGDDWVYDAEIAMDYEFDGEKLTLKVTDEEEDETEEVEITATVTDKKLTLKLPKEALEDMKEFFGEDAKETIELTKSDAKPKNVGKAVVVLEFDFTKLATGTALQDGIEAIDYSADKESKGSIKDGVLEINASSAWHEFKIVHKSVDLTGATIVVEYDQDGITWTGDANSWIQINFANATLQSGTYRPFDLWKNTLSSDNAAGTTSVGYVTKILKISDGTQSADKENEIAADADRTNSESATTDMTKVSNTYIKIGTGTGILKIKSIRFEK